MTINLSIYSDFIILLKGFDFDNPLLPLACLSIFLSILFLQSGLDKVLDFNGNLDFLTTHFKKTIFKNSVFVLLLSIIFLEILTACVFVVGLVQFVFSTTLTIYFLKLGVILSVITICCLFLGQRIAKDYVGAANLTIYFILTLLGFLFF